MNVRHNNRHGQQSRKGKGKVKHERNEGGRVVKDKFLTDSRYIADPVKPKNPVQKEFLEALKHYDCICFQAPAGVGKSFLTMSQVSDWLKKGDCPKITLSRPAVGMGNTIGLLKGGIRDKYEPYLLPLLNVLKTRYGIGFYETSLANGTIEILPLEYVRGLSINHPIIVDEVQNCTPEEIYTLLTRIEEGGKLILLGDPNQSDLKRMNGMEWLPQWVEKIPELQDHIYVVQATSNDITRGGLCKKTVKAREKFGL